MRAFRPPPRIFMEGARPLAPILFALTRKYSEQFNRGYHGWARIKGNAGNCRSPKSEGERKQTPVALLISPPCSSVPFAFGCLRFAPAVVSTALIRLMACSSRAMDCKANLRSGHCRASSRKVSILVALSLSLTVVSSPATEKSFQVLTLPASGEIQRADLWYAKSPPKPRAILVLCPGANGNGLSWIRQREWQEFADHENVALVGLHFESPGELLGHCQGYYQASKGSGELLLRGLRQIYRKDIPVLLFGFSGGAHFITRFIEWKPERILAWVAGGAGALETPTRQKVNPPGIMACGENDPRLGGALSFFKQGRAADKPWLWIEMPGAGHNLTPEFEDFSRRYFSTLLRPDTTKGVWVDIDGTNELSASAAAAEPSLSGWIPDRSLLYPWRHSHIPASKILSENR